jgi:hypothetical protein
LVCHENRLTGLEKDEVEASPIFDTFVSRYPPEVEKSMIGAIVGPKWVIRGGFREQI